MDISQDRIDKIKILVKDAFNVCYDKNVAFSIAKLSKEERLLLLNDFDFITELDCIKANCFSRDIQVYDRIIDSCQKVPTCDNGEEIEDEYAKSRFILANAQVLMKALDTRRDILFKQLQQAQDESKALNITFYRLERADYKQADNVELYEPDGENEIEEKETANKENKEENE